MKAPPQTLDQWLAHCERLHPKSIDLGLDRVRTVARRLGLHLACPVITVAGTNGKGSTCAMLESILRQAGYRTGLYTSPHLLRFEERLQLMGEPVAAADLPAAFAAVERARCDGDVEVSLTYFEFSTLAMLGVMARSSLDVAILEVGLGGRLDAVNIIDPDCAVITSIDLDHMELLGADREAIGFEKAGIMRTGRPVVLGDPQPPHSVLDHAREIGADLWRLGVDFQVSGEGDRWHWAASAARGGGRHHDLAYPALRGAHQLRNAGAALAALTALRDRLPVAAQALRQGLEQVQLPGRFQVLAGAPTLVLDVAHNPQAVAALVANLQTMGRFAHTHAVFGAMADKECAALIAQMMPLVDHWYFTDLPTPRAAPAVALLRHWQDLNPPDRTTATLWADPQSALRAATLAAHPADRIIAFGSFYTVGGVLAHVRLMNS